MGLCPTASFNALRALLRRVQEGPAVGRAVSPFIERVAAATYDVIPFRVLSGDQHPHCTIVNEFRLRHLDAFIDLFLHVLDLRGRAGLFDLEHVSLDGSKIEATASMHKAMSYERMRSELERLGGEIRELAAKAAEIDAEEDETYGVGKDAHEIRDELRRRELPAGPQLPDRGRQCKPDHRR